MGLAVEQSATAEVVEDEFSDSLNFLFVKKIRLYFFDMTRWHPLAR